MKGIAMEDRSLLEVPDLSCLFHLSRAECSPLSNNLVLSLSTKAYWHLNFWYARDYRPK